MKWLVHRKPQTGSTTMAKNGYQHLMIFWLTLLQVTGLLFFDSAIDKSVHDQHYREIALVEFQVREVSHDLNHDKVQEHKFLHYR